MCASATLGFAVIASTWPDEPPPVGLKFPDPAKMSRMGESPLLSDTLSEVGRGVRGLEPTDAFHRTEMAACVKQYADLLMTMTVLCALSIAIAVFVILDMDEPYGGLFGVPSTAMRNALADMMRPG